MKGRRRFKPSVNSNASESDEVVCSTPRVRRPFLKWAGGKTSLVPALRALQPSNSRRLIEPFVGSGVVALNLGANDNLLADANRDLVDVFGELKSGGDTFLAECEGLFVAKNN